MEQSKTCSRCKQIKLISEFGNHRGRTDGKQSSCFVCDRIRRAKYRAEHPDKVAKSQRKAYLRNRQARIDYAKTWVDSNRNKHRIYTAKWKSENRHVVAAHTRARNVRRKQNGVYLITEKELRKLKNAPCFYCGSTNRITVDHVVAIARGGTDSIGNLVAACKSCNSQKRELTIMEWRKYKANK